MVQYTLPLTNGSWNVTFINQCEPCDGHFKYKKTKWREQNNHQMIKHSNSDHRRLSASHFLANYVRFIFLFSNDFPQYVQSHISSLFFQNQSCNNNISACPRLKSLGPNVFASCMMNSTYTANKQLFQISEYGSEDH